MKSKLIASLMIILVLGIASLPLTHTVYGQSTNTMKLSTKGPIAESSNFHGAVMWTIINGNNGIVIIQSPAGRGMAHISISPSTNCSSSTATCLMSTVTDSGQIGVFKVGDTARFAIDANSNQETVSILTGTLAGFDVSVNLSKIWSYNVAPSTSTIPIPSNPLNNTTTHPVTTAIPTVNATGVNSTTTQKTSAKHLSADLSESFTMASH